MILIVSPPFAYGYMISSTQLHQSTMSNKNTISGSKGITFSGETFVVPETHDMVKTLFDPSIRKSICEILIVTLLLSNGLVFWFIDDNQTRIYVFVLLYMFWRLSYNFGIGWLLNQQSNYNTLVNWSIKFHIFSNDNTSFLSRFIKLEIHSQMGSNYPISKFPIEFNTWLVFRKIVDLILMLDFTTFICLVIACSINDDYQFIANQLNWLINTRLGLGSILILFNLWVKINAHNTIKDYAWYWGDFFFRQYNNEELIFDGVFEMFPHPMYSVGYIGYYGFALISKSYTVLVVALFGHFLQMIFLHYIENPHIDKIYGPSENDNALSKLFKLKDLRNFDNAKPLVGLWNFDWLRASDLINLIITVTYTVIIPLFSSFAIINFKICNYTLSTKNLIFGLTILIKITESLVINTLLILQSYYKTFTKWYLSNNIPLSKSLNNWSIIYNSLINLTYSSFIGFNVFTLLNNLSISDLLINDYLYLRIFIGVLLILTQVWINTSIIDQIGYFGWFYGDFFIPKSSLLPQRSRLTKAGVYRYLNNPEQIFGVCGIVGVTLIIPTVENLIISLLWVSNNFIRINFIEKIHMIKIYGEQEVLQDSGVTKTFKKHLLPELIQRRFSQSDKENHNRRRSSVLSESIDNFIKDLKHTSNDDITHKLSKTNLLELSQNLYFENSKYNIEISNLFEDDDNQYTFIGSPIQIKWSSPENHSPKDWIGLYKIIQTSYSRYKTLILSQGRWDWTNESEEGELIFKNNKLIWDEGIYEFRYHLEGKHDVAYISQPFEIRRFKIEVPITKNEEIIRNFAYTLKKEIFDKLIIDDDDKDFDITSPLIKKISNQSNNIIEIYEKISLLISKSTGIKVSSKFLIYNENENDNKNFSDDNESELTIKQLSLRLIHIKKILSDLSHEQAIGLESKKND